MESNEVSNPPDVINVTPSKGGCGGDIVATSLVLSAVSLVCIMFVIIKRRKFTAFEK
jgi:hypothetical protein